jgi:hypothetical protein
MKFNAQIREQKLPLKVALKLKLRNNANGPLKKCHTKSEQTFVESVQCTSFREQMEFH